ncbi:hypothetical protein [Kitasatospora sp. NPDC001132]
MPARTRTKRRSALPAIRISRLRPSTYNLRTGEVRTIVCPDCQTWQRIMGDTTLTIRDHHATDLSGADLAAGLRDRRCPSARRIVLVDLSADKLAKWQKAQDRRISPDAMPAESRRPTAVLKKIKAPAAPALHQLVPAPATADSARRAYEKHRSHCSYGCTTKTEHGTLHVTHCTDGERLGATYLRLLRREPQQRRNRVLYEEIHAAAERARARQFPTRRATEWAVVKQAVANADAQRAKPLVGALGPIRGIEAPRQTLRPTA